ncbi:serine protease [Lentzea sp. NBRC 105346]|uniref:S8 family peptidase n=1 Tax=Lentzea sp. NBRC 105346 TaxID=3032205 RepID=UPI0024A0529A|nr:S8 family peptidase [Lentzea sp. NBRC 105346]GLZ33548.1 serine protease [Lentzea sp. NBRC 105346]
MRKFALGVVAALIATGTATPAHAEGRVLGADNPNAVPESYIVMLREHLTSADVSSRYNARVNRTFTHALNGFSATMTVAEARRVAADPAVELVQQNQRLTITDSQNNPPSWGLDRVDQRALPFDQTYFYNTDASNVHAYVIDTGMRLTHTTFEGRAKSGYDAIDNDNDASDCHGHGTHVGGTVGGKEFGLAKKVNLVAVRVLDCKGSGTTEQVVAGIDWVTRNAVKPAVANMSLGGGEDAVLDAAVKRSTDAGITYAVAAGNSNNDACTMSPAREPSAITVGATARDDSRAYFSSYGKCLDIWAPGLGITSSWKDSDTATLSASGTSMASPHVAGAAALYLSKNPTATPQQVRDALVAAASSDLVTNPGPESPNKLLYTNHGITPPAPPPGCGTKTNSNKVEIPDAGEAISTAIRYAGCKGKAPKNTKVVIKITHDYKSDLKIDLIGPSGKIYPIKANGTGTVLQPSYTLDLSTEDKNGTWQLMVRDRSEGGTGTLDSWSITLPKKH